MAWLRNERDGGSTWVSCTPPSPVPMTRVRVEAGMSRTVSPGLDVPVLDVLSEGQQNYRAEAYMGCGETELTSKN